MKTMGLYFFISLSCKGFKTNRRNLSTLPCPNIEMKHLYFPLNILCNNNNEKKNEAAFWYTK